MLSILAAQRRLACDACDSACEIIYIRTRFVDRGEGDLMLTP